MKYIELSIYIVLILLGVYFIHIEYNILGIIIFAIGTKELARLIKHKEGNVATKWIKFLYYANTIAVGLIAISIPKTGAVGLFQLFVAMYFLRHYQDEIRNGFCKTLN